MNQSISNLSPEDKYKSVTIDFLRSLPELDVDNNKNHLIAALHAIGFDVSKKIDRVDGVLVRYRHSPMHIRETTIFQGQLRSDYPYKNIYNSLDILDVDARNPKNDKEFNVVVEMWQSESKQLVTDLPYEIPDYEGVKGQSEKNYNRSSGEKARYKIINPQGVSLSELMQQDELFESPFEEEGK
jgi:hypothetical protein